MRKILSILSVLSLVGCGAPDLGDPSWQHSTWCADSAIATESQNAAELWHVSAERVELRIVAAGSECDGVIELNSGKGNAADAIPGRIRILPRADWADYRTSFIAHELGHHLLGPAYGGADPYHPTNDESLMFHDSTTLNITAQDVALLP